MSLAPKTTSREKSILVVRLGDIGDLVISNPIASLIKHHAHNVRQTWVIEESQLPLMRNHPDIDHLIVWQSDRWSQLLKSGRWTQLGRELRHLRRQLKERHYDIALDLQGLFSSAFVARLSGARIRIGLGSKHGSYWLVTKTISRNIGEQTQMGSEYRYLLSQLGMPDAPWQTYIAQPERRRADITEHLGFDYTREQYAVFAPFTTRAEKRWPVKYWQQIALRIRGRYQLKTVILGTEDFAEEAQSIASVTGAINLIGKTQLDEAADVIRHASLFVGVATGFTHMAHTFKVPVVGIFGPSCPYSYAGPDTSKVIFHERFCSPCRKKPTCNNRYDCMVEIKPDEVLAEIKPLMKAAAEFRKYSS